MINENAWNIEETKCEDDISHEDRISITEGVSDWFVVELQVSNDDTLQEHVVEVDVECIYYVIPVKVFPITTCFYCNCFFSFSFLFLLLLLLFLVLSLSH